MALNKANLRREIAKARRESHKARLLELRGLIKAARVARKDAVKAVQLDCAAKRVALRESCHARADQARQEGRAEVERRRGTLRDVHGFEKRMQGYEKPRKLRSTTSERRAESDDEVRSNLDPQMVGVFDAVRRHIKGTQRKTRTEAFLEWAEENPEEVYGLLQLDADRYLAALLREERELARVPF